MKPNQIIRISKKLVYYGRSKGAVQADGEKIEAFGMRVALAYGVPENRCRKRNIRNILKAIRSYTTKRENVPCVIVGKNTPEERAIREFYRSREWRAVRYDILKVYGARCQACGATAADGTVIVVDHIRPLRRYWDLRLEPSNLQPLCTPCNLGKASRDETDWRPKAFGADQLTPPDGWLN